jgi:hypothetical protein
MRVLHRFDRAILAWALIASLAAAPLLADVRASQSYFSVPQGTQKVTLVISAKPAVLPDRAWDCSNAGTLILYTYGPDTWAVQVTDLNSGTVIGQGSGATQPLTFSCPDGIVPVPQPQTSMQDIDVSAFTATNDAVFFVGQTGQVHTIDQHKGGDHVPHFDCPQSSSDFSLSFSLLTASVSPPQFFFDLSEGAATTAPDEAKMLTHKYRPNDPGDKYLSHYQRATPVPPTGTRPQFDITGAVTNAPAGSDRKIYFKLLDPPDTADYAVAAGDAKVGDNADTANPPALLTVDGATRKGPGEVLETTWDDGRGVRIILEGTDHVAGDNYQIEASFAPDFHCESDNSCAKSAVITAWKRVYLEQHSMFRKGSFLADTADKSTSDVFVTDLSMFHSGDRVLFVHAPSDPSDGYDVEPHTIDVIPKNSQTGVKAHLHLTDSPLTRSYARNSKDTFLGDAVGVANTGSPASDSYVPSLGPPTGTNGKRPVDDLFAAAFVDVQPAPVTLSYIPLVDKIESVLAAGNTAVTPAFRFAQLWFESASMSNHRMLIGASSSADTKGTRDLGVTVTPGLFASYSFRRTIDEQTADPDGVLGRLPPEVVAYENAAHELLHQWRVNLNPTPAGGETTGHCAYNAYDNPRRFCHMHKNWGDDRAHNGERGDGIIKLHYVKQGSSIDSEYVTIRRAGEPMP